MFVCTAIKRQVGTGRIRHITEPRIEMRRRHALHPYGNCKALSAPAGAAGLLVQPELVHSHVRIMLTCLNRMIICLYDLNFSRFESCFLPACHHCL